MNPLELAVSIDDLLDKKKYKSVYRLRRPYSGIKQMTGPVSWYGLSIVQFFFRGIFIGQTVFINADVGNASGLKVCRLLRVP